MTKKEFMLELEDKLRVISLDERIDALRYYQDYFAEAGISDAMEVPETMGTPDSISKQIKDELSGINKEAYMDENVSVKYDAEYVPYYKVKRDSSDNGYFAGENRNNKTQDRGSYYDRVNNEKSTDKHNNAYRNASSDQNDNIKIIAIVILAVLSPLWIGFAGAAVGFIFSVFAVLGSLCFAAVVAGISLIISAFFTGYVSAGVLLAGFGMLSLAIGIGLFVIFVLYSIKFVPWLIKEIINLCKKIFVRREQA